MAYLIIYPTHSFNRAFFVALMQLYFLKGQQISGNTSGFHIYLRCRSTCLLIICKLLNIQDHLLAHDHSNKHNIGQKHTEGGNKGLRLERNPLLLSKPTEIRLGKLKPRWSWIWAGMSRPARRTSVITLLIKGKYVPTAEGDVGPGYIGHVEGQVLNTFFASVFIGNTGLLESHVP